MFAKSLIAAIGLTATLSATANPILEQRARQFRTDRRPLAGGRRMMTG
jgi:hypothetical protein